MARKKLDINIKEENQGKFTAWAKKNGFRSEEHTSELQSQD